jgi:hypothetical protein
MNKIIITPINLNNPSTVFGIKAKNDYLREKPKFSRSIENPKWDDSKYNKAVVGNMFAFVHQKKDRMEIFKIIKIISSSERPEYWDIESHKTRNIIYLSKMLKVMKFSEYKQNQNYSPNYFIRGTTNCKWNIRNE